MKNIFVELIDALASNNVDFVVCGGVACYLYGLDRVTLDLDISVSFEKDNLQKLIITAKQVGLMPRNPEPIENLLIEEKRNQWKNEKGAMVYTLVSNDGFKQIDIFLSYHKTHEKLKENAKKMMISGNEIMISSIDDLIEAKMRINPPRDRDETDIIELRKIRDGRKKE